MTSYVKLHWPAEPAVVFHHDRLHRLWSDSSGRYQVHELLIGDGTRTVYAYRLGRMRNRLLGMWRLRSQRPAAVARALGRARRICETDAAKEGRQERG
ncbi:MAG TPA: hypothetical protein PLQ89_21340 [Phycisphaerae bacterium]|jgi:hypothetical protein|nr:hypothetical protein [Phycisphaerae bacterium]